MMLFGVNSFATIKVVVCGNGRG